MHAPTSHNHTDAGKTSRLDHGRIERMHTERRIALRFLADDITPAFYAALREKIEYEHAFLLGEVEMQQARTARSDGLLDSAYFTRKRLGPDTF